MRVAIRADASVATGAGHVMRCAALAAALQAAGSSVLFVCRAQPGDLRAWLAAAGFEVLTLQPRDGSWQADAEATVAALADRAPDWLVVDHYGLDARWETALRRVAPAIMALDDLADRPHDADLLLDQNLAAQPDSRYAGLLPARCVTLLGPRFALLRPDFRAVRDAGAARSGAVGRLLCFFGGADAGNETGKALDALALLGEHGLAVDVVVGAANPHRDLLARRCEAGRGLRFHCQTGDMARLMGDADLFLGAGGSAVWERCCVGLPGIAVAVAANQVAVAQAAAQAGALCYLGASEEVSAARLADALAGLLGAPDAVRAMALRAAQLVDGLGAGRVAQRMREACPAPVVLRRACAADEGSIWEWRNAEPVRMASFDTAPIPADRHHAWFRAVLADPARHLLIAEREGAPIAVLRFDVAGQDAEVSVFVLPGLAGKGHGGAVLRAGERWLRGALPGIARVRAAIRSDNPASQAVFAKAGYRPCGGNVYQLALQAPASPVDEQA